MTFMEITDELDCLENQTRGKERTKAEHDRHFFLIGQIKGKIETHQWRVYRDGVTPQVVIGGIE